ncbi:integrator complex subunit 10-like [Physella acuta]|uniref:integrator complex subunit 10-like n=1 Tax=Physella acuta TaxID=109671 RepID=UPI0027DC89D3|nr:integrator complex subunit 10-like [Physella acuta]
MASAVAEQELSDVDWLVMRARSFPKTDPYSAKSWLITAKSLFPQSFVIQFESYLVEKTAKNVDEAARYLQDMLQSFPNEPRLWSEVHSILESLQKESQDQKVAFLIDLFAAIPTSTQCVMLLRVSESISDVLERCQLLLLAMKKFPNLVKEHGLKLVEMLVKEEINSNIVNNPVNCYRKLLVCDVMPLVLQKGGHLEVNMFQLYLWLQRATEFYVSYVSQSHTHDLSVDAENSKGRSSGLPDSEMQVADPWGNLLKLLLLIGQRLKWDMESDLVNKTKEYQIQSLQHQLLRVKLHGTEANNKQILHSAMVLFVHSMVSYVSYVDAESAVVSTHLIPVILVENVTNTKVLSTTPCKAKKPKLDPSLPNIHASPNIPGSAAILQAFETACKCYEILNSTEDMKFEFYNLCQNWRKETQTMLAYFQADLAIYTGNYEEAVTQLQTLALTTNAKMKMRNILQLACCYFFLKQYSKSCELLIDLIDTIPASSPISSLWTAENSLEDKSDTGVRSLLLLHCVEGEILPFCLQFLIFGLKEKMNSPQRTDSILAHLIILLQFDWPKQESLFCQVITAIQKQGSFTYNTFFSYVHQVDILEEFAFLDTVEGGKVNLDIMPISTKAIAQQRTVTRGVNKGVKEDFKATLEKQVGSMMEPSHVLIRRFLKEERTEIMANFN